MCSNSFSFQRYHDVLILIWFWCFNFKSTCVLRAWVLLVFSFIFPSVVYYRIAPFLFVIFIRSDNFVNMERGCARAHACSRDVVGWELSDAIYIAKTDSRKLKRLRSQTGLKVEFIRIQRRIVVYVSRDPLGEVQYYVLSPRMYEGRTSYRGPPQRACAVKRYCLTISWTLFDERHLPCKPTSPDQPFILSSLPLSPSFSRHDP